MTAQEIIKALRCTATVHTEDPDCEHCPYVRTEHLTGVDAELFGDVLRSCDIDKIGLDAADMLGNMNEPVVRCKDCKHRAHMDVYNNGRIYLLCGKSLVLHMGACEKHIVPPNFFCGYGETEDDDEEAQEVP